MEQFTYTTWREDYANSIDECGDPQQYGDHGDYWLKTIEGCGLKVSPKSIELLERGVGGVNRSELSRTQVGDYVFHKTANEPGLRRIGRELLRIYLLYMTIDYSWAERMEAISDLRNAHSALPGSVIQNLLSMVELH